jgi:phosphoglycerate dehydrogenase-like enzyme
MDGQIVTFEAFSDRDRAFLHEAAEEFDVRVHAREAPRGDERTLLAEHRDLSLADVDTMRDLETIFLLDYGRATLPLNRLAGRGVAIRRVPNLAGLGVAEHVFALVLALKKRIVEGHLAVTANRWRPDVTESIFTDQRAHVFNWSGIEGMGWLYGQTMGIVGFGRIGKAVARRAQAFDMQVLYYNRHRLSSFEEQRLGVRYATLDDLVSTADVITLHVPFTSATEHLIDGSQFARMQPSAILINAARGRVVEEQALVAALRDRKIAGAGLDVLVYEPPHPDNPLLQLENVVFSPHVAGVYDPVARREQFRSALRWASERVGA